VYVTLNLGADTGVSGLEAISWGIPTYGIQLDDSYISSKSDYVHSDMNLKSLASKIVSDWTDPANLHRYAENQHIFLKSKRSMSDMVDNYIEVYKLRNI